MHSTRQGFCNAWIFHLYSKNLSPSRICCFILYFAPSQNVIVLSLLLQTMCRWLLSTRKNYRNVTYHNWRHAFSVAQTMFAIIEVSVKCPNYCNVTYHNWRHASPIVEKQNVRCFFCSISVTPFLWHFSVQSGGCMPGVNRHNNNPVLSHFSHLSF